MADISSMTLLNGDVVNLKDSAAREAASSAASGLTGKVDKAQGVQNTGKILKVGSSGVLELVDPTSGSGDVVGPNSATDDHVATFDGTTGKLIQDSGFTIGTSVPSDAVFTDTTYESLEPEVGGTDESLVTTGEKAEWNAKADLSDIPDVSGFYTKPVTGIPASDLASGVIPDISGKADLDENGKVPSSQLPSYVDDVLEYADLQHFPLTGESGKIYIAQDTNKTYRWSGSTYTEISESLALGETSSTAYRGDRGADAYAAAVTNVDSTPTANSTHLVTSGGVAAAIPDISGKVTGPASSTDAHVAVFNGTGGKTIKDSGFTIGTSVPSDAKFTDTTYSAATQSANGLMSSTDKTKLDGIATGATANVGTITGITMNGASKGTSGVVDLGTVITSHQDISGKVSGPSSSTDAHIAVFNGTGGKTIKDSGFTIGTSVPANAVFTDTDKSTKFTCVKQIGRGSNIDPIQSGYFAGMSASTGIDNKWWHILSMDWTNDDADNWISQFALPTHDSTSAQKGLQYRTRSSGQSSNWVKCLDTDNYTSYAAQKTEAVKNITRSGTTFTATRCDNTTFTFTQQDTTYESKAAASGGTAVSLVTTGEKYTWNSKTSNTGTVTKVSTGAGLTGGDITTTGTISISGMNTSSGSTSKCLTEKGTWASFTNNAGTITGIKMNGASKGTSGVVDLGTVITAHQDISGKVSGPSSSTDAHVAVFNGTGGKTIKDSGFTIGKSVPSNAVFTDHYAWGDITGKPVFANLFYRNSGTTATTSGTVKTLLARQLSKGTYLVTLAAHISVSISSIWNTYIISSGGESAEHVCRGTGVNGGGMVNVCTIIGSSDITLNFKVYVESNCDVIWQVNIIQLA